MKNIKEFSCKLCEKSYTQSQNLKNHMKTVHKVPYTQTQNLNINKKFHGLQENPFKSIPKKFEFAPEQICYLETIFNIKKYINVFDIGKNHALKKYSQFTLNTSCF